MTDLAYLTVAEGAALLRARKAVAGGMDQGAARPHRGDRFRLQRLPRRHRRQGRWRRAKAAEAEIARGQWRGPMHGVPYAAKDIFDIEGLATTCHSKLRKDHRAGPTPSW
jgi:aspartyl-tRNA(Asn)/glutamyl-tRNA(Gln) amidotransferase subunit A